MKKILAIILAMFMVVAAFASCTEEPAETPDGSGVPGFNETPEETPDETPEETPDDVTFTDVDEKVYVAFVMNDIAVNSFILRSEPDFDNAENVAHYIDPGTELRRIGYNETWSKVVYENEEYYCSSKYLVSYPDTSDIVFAEVNETVYVNTAEQGEVPANSYVVPVRDTVYFWKTIEHGTEVKRTGIFYDGPEGDKESQGWSRIEITDGAKTLVRYIRNSMLSTTAASDSIPEGYKLYSNGTISFAYPEAWTKTEGSMDMLVDANTGNNIIVAYENKNEIYKTLTTADFDTVFKPGLEAQGLTVANGTIAQEKAGELDVTVISFDTTTSTGASMKQILNVVTVGELTYSVTITETVSVPALHSTFMNSLKVVG